MTTEKQSPPFSPIGTSAMGTQADNEIIERAKARRRVRDAAPELLATLVEIRKWMDADIMGPWDAKFCAEIDALVAKATGSPS